MWTMTGIEVFVYRDGKVWRLSFSEVFLWKVYAKFIEIEFFVDCLTEYHIATDIRSFGRNIEVGNFCCRVDIERFAT